MLKFKPANHLGELSGGGSPSGSRERSLPAGGIELTPINLSQKRIYDRALEFDKWRHLACGRPKFGGRAVQ